MAFQSPLVARAEMLIRRPVEAVFEAFADPAHTTRFWFTRSSGKLVAGERVQWDWEMYGHSAEVNVVAVEKNKRIVVEWPGEGGPTTIEWIFDARTDGTTFVSVRNFGFHGDDDSVARQALDSTEGFTLALAGCKAYLEHGVILNLVGDRFPDAHVK